VAKINQALLVRLHAKLGLSRRRVYSLVEEKVRQAHLPRHLAAVALASERGINISRFATAEDLATIRQTAIAAAPRPVVPPTQKPTETRSETRQPRGRTRRKAPLQRRRGTSVFVVHGRNERARDAMFQFLRALGLQPIEWNQAVRMTGEPTPYVGTILDTAFREAAAVVVLLTPDDEARLRKAYRKRRDPGYEHRLTGQARPNVLFEAGMAFGRNPQSTVLAQISDVRQFSDVAGRHIVRVGNDPTTRQALATRLANAGCNVDTSGSDWLTAGDFRA